MKRYLSVFSMLARPTLLPMLLITAVMSAAQVWLFESRLQTELSNYSILSEHYNATASNFIRAEYLFSVSHITWVFAAAFVLLCVLLALPGCGYHSKTSYTVRRLSISERSVFYLQTAVNVVYLLALWAVEVLLCILLCRRYITAAPAEIVSELTEMLTFYRSPFLHALLPLADTIVWVRNIILLLILSASAAIFPYCQRRSKFSPDLAAYALLTLINFEHTLGDGFNVFLLLFCGAIIAGSIFHTLYIREDAENTPEVNPYENYPYPR